MRLWNLFHLERRIENRIADKVAAGKKPAISSYKELEIYLANKINNAEFTKVFVAIMNKTGDEAAIEIKRGGEGNPYQVEYIKPKLSKKITKKEVKARKQQIIAQLGGDNSLSQENVEVLQSELAQLSGNRVILWVNSPTEEDFCTKEDLFTEAMNETRELFGN